MNKRYFRNYLGAYPINDKAGMWKPQDVFYKQKENKWSATFDDLINILNPDLWLDGSSLSGNLWINKIDNDITVVSESGSRPFIFNSDINSFVVSFTDNLSFLTNYNYLSSVNAIAYVFILIKHSQHTGYVLHSDGMESIQANQSFSILSSNNNLNFNIGGGGSVRNSFINSWYSLSCAYNKINNTGFTSINGFDAPATVNNISVNNTLRIGARGGGVYFNGLISDILIFSYYPTIEQKQLIEGLIHHKRNLQNLLPSDHPYKNLSPI